MTATAPHHQPARAVPGTPLLEVEHLTIAFPTSRGPVEVVKDLSFRVEPDSTLGIVGESGSGKSMTSLAVMGLVPRGGKVTGSIKLAGEELVGRSDKELQAMRGDRMAMVFQDPLSSLNPYYTVGLQIEEAYRSHRSGSRKSVRSTVVAALDRVGIKEAATRVDHYPHQFSGGMRQRIMIAMALCLEPELLIADEPTTALDVTVQAQILDLMRSIRAETGMGMLVITHDLAVVSSLADEVLVMQGGHRVESGTTERVFTAPEDPYTHALLEAIPRIDAAYDRQTTGPAS
ncbi:ABC transporter ATP-binding protein [Clavibacter michiganensis]|uniref:ABC transporter ATP-binding protein n=1 Tax=Clavibacter michiganensis TaxID=28447 RepID=UPI0029310FFD|nr:ABC transporter ATP-binding protein [Clavibacter michiganensis]